MTEQLSGVTVVIIIGGGVLTFVLLFIFAKRQIMRFALRSRRGPHMPIGHSANKSLKREIDRRIQAIPRIVHEPLLLNESKFILDPQQKLPSHYFRLKAVDDIKLLEREISRSGGGITRQPCDSLRAFLLNSLAIPLGGRGQKSVHQLCDMYEHARHDPAEFGDEEYQVYNRMLLKLIDAARLLKPFAHKSSPNRTPTRKQATVRPLLDPGSLNIPVATANKLTISNIHTQYTSMQDVNTLENNFDDEILCVESKSPTSVLVHTQKVDNETTV
ncbi:protein C1orf43 homolog [Arctopsyche grandis]|uniref:protein C1orf43 homolog n=1 Tax=Arctopsyche grandis TaxID=121162 RepID=UPI00406D6EEC